VKTSICVLFDTISRAVGIDEREKGLKTVRRHKGPFELWHELIGHAIQRVSIRIPG
jgi:hypothetical protein